MGAAVDGGLSERRTACQLGVTPCAAALPAAHPQGMGSWIALGLANAGADVAVTGEQR